MVDRVFTPMLNNNGSYSVTMKKPFTPQGTIRRITLETVATFAFDMTFGTKGAHRNNRTGGSTKRSEVQILTDTFQGKLSEFALANILYKQEGFKAPETSTYALGEWESADFELGKSVISVKSTKYFGNLLLLEKGDWDSTGSYKQSGDKPKTYSHIVLVRVAPFMEDLIRPRSQFQAPSYEEVLKVILAQEWKYEITGFINSEDLKKVIVMGHEIPKGSLLNGTVKMDASNYYVQAGDLRSPEELVASF